MHIAEGILPVETLAFGAALAAGGTALGLRSMDAEAVPRVAVLSAAFFTASLIHIPLGPVSVHLLLTGLLGIVLGWAVFPACLVALALQTLFFGYGGLTVLGVNTFTMAAPALLSYYLFRRGALSDRTRVAFVSGFAAGALTLALNALIMALALRSAGAAFVPVAGAVLAAHIPVLVIEGLVTGSAVVFLSRVKPEVFAAVEKIDLSGRAV